MQVAIIDYGVGNLASVEQGLRTAGMEPFITREKERILQAHAVVLPGVGAFPKGMENLEKYEMIPLIRKIAAKGIPLLGICLGMQLLFEESEEFGAHKGLALLRGKVMPFPQGLKIPHMGWNTLKHDGKHLLLQDIPPENSYVYFVHSYYVSSNDSSQLVAMAQYKVEFPAIVCFNNIVGMQFHPEKSGGIGIQLLKNFGELVRNASYPSN